jgi:hypothetical protein
MPSEGPREPINWREDLRDLFYAEAAIIMQEVFSEIRDALRDGTVNSSRLVDPRVAALRSEIFDNNSDDNAPPFPSWMTDDEGTEG